MRATPPPRQRIRLAVVLAAASLALAGCGTGSPAPTSSTTTDAGTATPSEPGTPAPPATLEPSEPTGAPFPETPLPDASPAPVAQGGCPANDVSVPAGADTATIPDVDGDGLDDTEFYTEADVPFGYGIHTASGATAILPDDLAGPNTHSGWSARLANGTVVTVIDDGRAATLHAFVDCRFVTSVGDNGQPYVFLLNGFGQFGTGVACSADSGQRQLLGLLAKRNDAGRYDITSTVVSVSKDGRRATNGATSKVASNLAPSDPQVKAAMSSHCGDIPKVATSGH